MLIDSTVFIEFFRNGEKARKYLTDFPGEIKTSRIVVMEIVAGLRSKIKIERMRKQLENLDVKVLEVDERISRLAGEVFEKYHGTEGMGMMDAFIAATAIVMNEELATHNEKHFKFIRGLKLVWLY